MYLGPVAGLLIVGAVNLLVGGLAIRASLARLKRPHQLELTMGSELAQTAREVMPVGHSASVSDAV